MNCFIALHNYEGTLLHDLILNTVMVKMGRAFLVAGISNSNSELASQVARPDYLLRPDLCYCLSISDMYFTSEQK